MHNIVNQLYFNKNFLKVSVIKEKRGGEAIYVFSFNTYPSETQHRTSYTLLAPMKNICLISLVHIYTSSHLKFYCDFLICSRSREYGSEQREQLIS